MSLSERRVGGAAAGHSQESREARMPPWHDLRHPFEQLLIHVQAVSKSSDRKRRVLVMAVYRRIAHY